MTLIRLVHAEWTKLRSVRARLVALVAAAVAMTLFSVLSAAGERRTCSGPAGCPRLVTGPDGRAVLDGYKFVGRPLDGDGTLTVRVGTLTGLLPPPGRALSVNGPPGVPLSEGRAGVQPWAKAGLIITESTGQGASYAAIMVAAGHGVRFQYDYTHDIEGPAEPDDLPAQRWLRLIRSGDTVAGYASADGAAWTRVGTARLAGLSKVSGLSTPSGQSRTVRAGLFVASPQHSELTDHPFVTSGAVGPTLATARFSDLAVEGAWPDAEWTGQTVGTPDGSYPALPGSYHRLDDGSLQISGSGDIAPAVGGAEGAVVTVDHALSGGFVALIMVVALGALSATSEYRRGLMRVTLSAVPRRGSVLAAKAVVVGGATFLVMVPAAALSLLLGRRALEANHNLLYSVGVATELRVVVGTAGLIAVAAVLALALGVITRRSGPAITIAVVAVVVPYVLFQALPAEASEWLLRVTPTAALAIQQTLPVYHQVDIAYTPVNGYYPLSPWAGFAVLCAYAAGTLAVAAVVFRRRDS